MVPEKLTQWFDRPVEDYQPSKTKPDYANKVYRLAYIWDDEESRLENSLGAFVKGSGVEETVALILGTANDEGGSGFGTDSETLLRHVQKFPKLRGLFLGEMDQEESEISWIEQSDVGQFLQAFPALEELRVRGGSSLEWAPVRHICLKKLVIETGGMPKEVLHGILESVFPELEHLELWLGTDEYGWDGEVNDVRPFLFQNPFPKLKYLGLRNSMIQDDIAELAATAPILSQLETLDLSLGSLTNRGGEALLACEKIRGLKLLDLHRHYMGDDLISRFKASGVNVNTEDQETPDNWDGEDHYYVSVSE